MLATQTLMQARPKTMAVTINGSLPDGVTAKDLVLTLITHTGTGGGQGYIVEYRGQAIEELSMEGRMTVCNMSIEWGAKAGLIAPDQTTFDYIEGRPEAPKGADWDAAVEHWKSLVTDDDAVFDEEIVLDASTMTPFVTWGTNPGQGVPLGGVGARPGRLRGRRRPRVAPRRRWSTWPSRPAPRCARSRSTPSSSARAPTAASRTCASPPRSSRAAGSTRTPACSSYPGRCGCGCRPRTRASTSSSRRRAPSGAAPDAPCAWA